MGYCRCEHCGNIFFSGRKEIKKYCSEVCRGKAKNKISMEKIANARKRIYNEAD